MSYDESRSIALELLTEAGKSLTLIREESGGVYDPVEGATSGGTTLNLNGVGVLLNYSNREVASGFVLTTDRKLLYRGDELLIGDNYNGWRVYSLNELDPDETGTILTTAQMRK